MECGGKRSEDAEEANVPPLGGERERSAAPLWPFFEEVDG